MSSESWETWSWEMSWSDTKLKTPLRAPLRVARQGTWDLQSLKEKEKKCLKAELGKASRGYLAMVHDHYSSVHSVIAVAVIENK